MLQRNLRSDFVGGAYVFPGGGVDPEDASAELERVCQGRTDTEAYRVALTNDPPSVYVVLRRAEGSGAPYEYEVFCATASAFEAQDYLDSGEEIVEPVPMPPALVGWLSAFVERHHVEEEFRKRRRDRIDTDVVEDGRGDARVRQEADVYRSPAARRAARDGGGVH